ncbi:MAG: UspA domain protein [Pedosphaera sp.]|nr:UspA domain protein [Pedosphaera sp.]
MKILICSDGSEQADKAIRLGANVAAACQAEVTLLGIVESAGKPEAIMDALRRGQQLLEDKKIHAELIIKTGQPVDEIVKRTEEAHYDLVVIGATRKDTQGLFWVSSKTYKIIKSVPPPVLVVMEKTSTIKRILICSGGKKYIENAVALTGQIAKGMGASVTLLHVMPEPPAMYARLHRMEVNVSAILDSKSELGRNLRSQRELLESLGVPTEVHLRQGPVLEEIFREIQTGNYDLIVTGSSLNRGSLRTYMLGNVTREIVNRTNCAVLVVRAGVKSEGITQSLIGWFDRVTRRTQGSKTDQNK